MNARDGIRPGDTTETPLQFVYQPADCRIYYTPEMAVDQVATWKTVADTAFNGINHCVAGKYPTSNSTTKRNAKPSQHRVRRNVNIAEHYHAISDVWTGKGDITLGGDAYMLP